MLPLTDQLNQHPNFIALLSSGRLNGVPKSPISNRRRKPSGKLDRKTQLASPFTPAAEDQHLSDC